MRFEVIVKINGVNQYLETSDYASFPINYNIADIEDISKKNSSYSKTLSFPDTKNNRKVFEYIYSIQSDSTFDPTKKSRCWIIKDTLTQLEGFLQLTDIVYDNEGNRSSYNCVIYADNGNLFTNIGEKLLTDLNLSQFDHNWTINSITQSWTRDYTNGYYYPLIDYGFGLDTQKLSSGLSVNYFYPSYYLKPIVDQIILEGGYSYTSDFLNSFDFKNIVIPFSNKNLVPSFSNTLVFQNDGLLFSANPTGSVSVISNSSQFGSSITSFNAGNDIYDPNSFYNITGRVYQNGISDPIAQRFGVKIDITYIDYSGSTDGWPFDGDILIWIKRSRSQQTGVTVSNWVNTPTYNQFYSYPSIPFLSTSFYSMRYVGIPQNEITHTNLGGNVWRLEGTIYSKYLTGEDIARTPLYSGEEVRFFAESTNISDPSVAFTIATSSVVFSEVDSNQTTIGSLISFNNNIPKNIKQKDFLSSIMKAFNLYVEPDKNNLNNLIIEPRDDYYRKYQVIKDWSDKLDVSKNITSQILSNTQNRINYFTYKEDKDYYNSVYKTNTGQIFGEYKSETNNEFTNGEKKVELIFSPTPINKITQTNDVYAPTIVNYNNGNFTKVDGMNLRLLYKNLLGLNGDIFKVRNSNNNQSFTQSFYPYAGPMNDPLSPTYSLNFGQVDMFYNGYNETINNLFFNYYQNQVEELNNKNARLITAYFKLDPQDISNFRFSDLIFFKYKGTEGYYRVNKIVDYDPSVNATTKVELITAIDYKIKRSRRFSKPIADSVRPGPIGTIGTIGIGVGIIGDGIGVVVNGDNNSFVGPKSLLIGDDNSVSTRGSVGVLGDLNQVSGEYILTTGVRNRLLGQNLVVFGNDNNLQGVTNSYAIGSGITLTQSNTTIITNDIISISASQININGTISGSFSIPTNYISTTITNLNTTLIPGNLLQPGSLYRIDTEETTYKNNGIFLTAITTNELDKKGTIIFLAPGTYQTTTDGFGNVWLGIWQPTLTPSVGDLVIWAGLVWSNVNGLVGASIDEYTLDSEWSPIGRNTFSNGEYIEMFLGCQYDYTNNWIEKQFDGNSNIVGVSYITATTISLTINPTSVTDWNANTLYALFYENNVPFGIWNNITTQLIKNKCSSIYNNRTSGSISGNTIPLSIFDNIEVDIVDNNNEGQISNNNQINQTFFDILKNSNKGSIIGNENTFGGSLSLRQNYNNGDISNNELKGNLQYNGNNGQINNNIGLFSGDNVEFNTNSGGIGSNQGPIIYNSNNGEISSSTNIQFNSNNGYITANTSSSVIYNSNLGNITSNTNGDISNNFNGGNINSNSNTGVISNNFNGSDIFNNSNTGDITFNSNLGVIVNNINAGNISLNSNDGQIDSNSCEDIFNNSNSGNISSNSNTGDIEFNNNNGDISNNSNGGPIQSNSNLGSIDNNSNTQKINLNSNNGSIGGNDNEIADISNNQNNGVILNNTGSGGPWNIQNNINNGFISGNFIADVDDTIVNKT